MNKIFSYFRNKFKKSKHYTEIKFSFDREQTNPNVSLSLSDLDDKTAEELASIFHILQSGAAQQFLVDKIAAVSAQHNMLFLENVYDNYNRMSTLKKPNTKSPMVRPLAVFNTQASNDKY